MKIPQTALRLLIAPLALVFMFTSLVSGEEPVAETAADKKTKTAVYRHVVMFGFKESATKEDIKTIEQAFVKLPEKIDTIIDFEWGTNVSPESHDQGHTHCFLVTFKDKAGLEVYLPHPAHKKFVELLLPSLEKVTVLDYVSR